MVSEKQRIANHNNGLKSTGPKTVEGKRIASRNAVRHGLLSNAGLTVIRGEDRTEFKEFSDNLRGDLKPVGQLESLLAERITSFFWRLKRTSRMEQGLLDILSSSPQNAGSPAPGQKIPYEIIITKAYGEPETDLEYQEYLKSKGRLDANGVALPAPVDPAAQSSLPSEVSDSRQAASEGVVLSEEQLSENLGRMVQQDFKGSKLLEKLLRYEGQIERSLYRALLELQKLQSNRAHSEAIDVLEDAVESNPSRGEPMCSPAPEIVIEDLPSVGWALAHAEAQKPNEPILAYSPSEPQSSTPPAESPQSSPSFQEGLPQSGEGSLPLAGSWPLEAGSCSPEKPNEPISEEIVPPQMLLPIENSKWKMDNFQSPIINQQSLISPSGAGYKPFAKYSPPKRISPHDTWLSRLSDEELDRLTLEIENQSSAARLKHPTVHDFSHLTDEELDRLAKELG
jgi:hypothetical protein